MKMLLTVADAGGFSNRSLSPKASLALSDEKGSSLKAPPIPLTFEKDCLSDFCPFNCAKLSSSFLSKKIAVSLQFNYFELLINENYSKI